MAKKAMNRIKLVLVSQDRSNVWLAKQLDKSPYTISRWCTNDAQPSLETLFQIAAVLKVDVRKLIVSTDPRKKGDKLEDDE